LRDGRRVTVGEPRMNVDDALDDRRALLGALEP
jgi:hypothetical protein